MPLRLGAWRLVVLDSGERHRLASSGYNTRRAECARACELLGIEHLSEADGRSTRGAPRRRCAGAPSTCSARTPACGAAAAALRRGRARAARRAARRLPREPARPVRGLHAGRRRRGGIPAGARGGRSAHDRRRLRRQRPGTVRPRSRAAGGDAARSARPPAPTCWRAGMATATGEGPPRRPGARGDLEARAGQRCGEERHRRRRRSHSDPACGPGACGRSSPRPRRGSSCAPRLLQARLAPVAATAPAGGARRSRGCSGPGSGPPAPTRRRTGRPSSGRPISVYSRHAARAGANGGTPNSTEPIAPPGRRTRASSRIVAGGSST